MNAVFLVVALAMLAIAAAFILRPALAPGSTTDAGARKLVIAMFGIIAFSAVGLYATIGEPSGITSAGSNVGVLRPVSTAMAAAPSAAESKVGSVSQLLAGLEARLEKQPDDAKGWLLLAKSYEHLGRVDDARDAYEKAAALGTVDAALASKLTAGGNRAAASAVRGRVSVADDADEFLQPSDTVFIVAKDPAGGPMPLAVLRRPATDLPFDFVLDESASMMAGRGIADADSIVVSARISHSGDALDTAANVGAQSDVLAPADAGFIDLVITANKAAME